jgi:hemolysin activation/secretion protein
MNCNHFLAASTCLILTGYAQAQALPNAGSITRELQAPQAAPTANKAALPQSDAPTEASPASSDPTPIAITGITITGATLFAPATLQALVADVASGQHTLSELQAAARRITLHYRQAGYFLARAYLPAQKMTSGVVTIAVLEGKLGEVKVLNASRLSDQAIEVRLARLGQGSVMHRATLDRALLLLGDVPGVGRVDSRLAPGQQTGETMLVASVQTMPTWAGRIDADNAGSLYSGRYRLGVGIEGNSPLGLGEKVSASVLGSNEKLVYGNAEVQAPVGVNGLTAGLGLSHTQYALGSTYKALDAVGTSNAVEVHVRFPFQRAVAFNLYGQASLAQRRLRDEVRSTSTQTDKQATVGSLALQADWRDQLGGLDGSNQASLTVTGGSLDITSADAAALDAVSAHTAGAYSKLGLNLSRQQSLPGKLSASGQLRGQWANKNLDSSEKFSLGGASGVRAYPTGEASGDTGWLATMALRYALAPQLNLSVFHDAGSVSVNARPYLGTGNVRNLSGSGLGLAGRFLAFEWALSLAWRHGAAPLTEPDRAPRLWAQGSWRF